MSYKTLLKFCCCVLLPGQMIIAGCAVVSPPVKDVTVEEHDRVMESFNQYLTRFPECRDIEAEFTATYRSFLNNGTISGFLQAKAPSMLKFVGVNPFGQPLVFMVTDGRKFWYVDVPQAKGYEGQTSAEKFKKYVPKGFRPEYAYPWLVGQLESINLDNIAVRRDIENGMYWLEYCCGADKTKGRIVFDAEKGLIFQHFVLDNDGEIITDMTYANHMDGGCRFPREIIVKPLAGNGTLSISLSDVNPDYTVPENEFDFDLPKGFTRIEVK